MSNTEPFIVNITGEDIANEDRLALIFQKKWKCTLKKEDTMHPIDFSCWRVGDPKTIIDEDGLEKVLNPILKQLSKQKPTGVDLDKVIQQVNNYNKSVNEYEQISNDIKISLASLISMYRRNSMLAYGKSARLFVEGDTHITSLEKLIEVKATSEVKKAFELKQKIIEVLKKV